MLALALIAVSLLQGLVHAASVKPKGHPCRCVSDQWQAILASTDREFDLRGARTGVMENQIFVSYDFKNKKFAMTDLTTGNRAIADYGQGFKYVVRNDGCSQIGTAERMKQMCLPDHAEYGGEYRLGVALPVDVWAFTAPYNMSMKTTVLRKHCLPVTEEVFMTQGNYASLTSSMYLDVTVGIKDYTVFDPPVNCVFNTYRSRMHERPDMAAQTKRAEGAWSLLHLLREGALDKN